MPLPRSVLVFGATSDLATGIVELLANRGTTRFSLTSRDPDDLGALAESLRASGAEVATLAFDAKDVGDHDRIVAEAFARNGPFDAALIAFGELGNPFDLNCDAESVAQVVQTNFTGAATASLATARSLAQQGSGTLAVISSVVAMRARGVNLPYGAAKAGLDAFLSALDDELRGTGAHLMIVRPGFVPTKMTRDRSPSPFSSTIDEVARRVVRGLERGARRVWSPAPLTVLGPALRFVPGPIWRRLAGRGMTRPGSALTTAERGPATLVTVARALRLIQWPKNLLVLAAPGAAALLDEGAVLIDALLALLAFCLASSATYLLNDVLDREHDRLHPDKRARPVASGAISPPVAIRAAAALALVALALAFVVRWQFLPVIAGYLALSTFYSLVLKHVPVLDVLTVSGGFVLRAAGGAVATDIPITGWFYLVVSAGSLLVAAGKRHAELHRRDLLGTRPALRGYRPEWIQLLATGSALVAVAGHVIWAVSSEPSDPRGLFIVSSVPFAGAISRYLALVRQGRGEQPEILIWRDRLMLSATLCWLAVYGVALYRTTGGGGG